MNCLTNLGLENNNNNNNNNNNSNSNNNNGASRSAFKILAGKHTGKRPLGRPRRNWEDSIRMDLKAVG